MALTSQQYTAYNYFLSRGWSPNFSIAMTAALSGESHPWLDTRPLQGGDAAFGGGNGIASWSASRWNQIGQPQGLQAQLAAVVDEVNSGYPRIASLTGSNADPATLTNAITGGVTDGGSLGSRSNGSYLTPQVANGFQRWNNIGLSGAPSGAGLSGPSDAELQAMGYSGTRADMLGDYQADATDTSGMYNYSNPSQSYALPTDTGTAPIGDTGSMSPSPYGGLGSGPGAVGSMDFGSGVLGGSGNVAPGSTNSQDFGMDIAPSSGASMPGGASTDPTAIAAQPDSGMVNAAPGPLGDILGYQDPSQTYSLPAGLDTAGASATSDTAQGDMTIPQAIDKQATVESKAIAGAASAQDKTAGALAKDALESAQKIAAGQQASSKEQTSSQEQSSQGLLNQVKDMFVRFFLGAAGLVLIAAAVWYFAGKPTPPAIPVPREA